MYENGKIYKIECISTKDIYIGSTCKSLEKRLSVHKAFYKRFLKDNNRCELSSFNILKNNNYKIVLLENYPCKNRDELTEKEREYFNNLECVNINKPRITIEEAKELRPEIDRKYYLINKDKKKQYYQDHKEIYKQRYKDNKIKKLGLKINIEEINNEINNDEIINADMLLMEELNWADIQNPK